MLAEFDAVVIGAGPAGSAAAATLALAGRATVLLAGGGASCWVETTAIGIASLLPDLGLPQGALQSVATACRGGLPALHIDRAAFDALLRNAARRAGACLPKSHAADLICDSHRIVGVRTGCGQTLRCRIVIDASGSRAWLVRRATLRVQPLSAPLVAWRGEVGCIPADMADDAAQFLPRHDGWLFLATRRGRTTWTAIRSGRGPPDLALLPVTARPRAWNVTWRLARPVAGRGGLLAGDAAGRLDPACGQGLATAVASGIAAGRTAIACLADQASESIYLAAYDGWFADRILAAAAMLRQRYADNGIRLAAEPAAA